MCQTPTGKSRAITIPEARGAPWWVGSAVSTPEDRGRALLLPQHGVTDFVDLPNGGPHPL